jgi:arsenite oxidase small subunit
MNKTGRRGFIKFGAAGGLATLSGSAVSEAAVKKESQVRLDYPERKICQISDLKLNEPFSFSYPDKDSPCLIIKFGNEQKSGVGPDSDIVAYSQLCSHLGCAVSFHKERKTFICPCHFSQYDPEKNGRIICGQATRSLPRILLKYNATNKTISAVGIDGMIYGRQANIL